MSLRLTLSALVVSLPLLLAGCSVDDPTTAAAVPRLVVAPAEAVALIARPGTVVLDVRTPAEFAQGHVAGARNIDLNDSAFRDQLYRLDRQAPYVVVYCRTGNRSAAAVAAMQELGFVDVADAGGLDALAAAGAPRA